MSVRCRIWIGTLPALAVWLLAAPPASSQTTGVRDSVLRCGDNLPSPEPAAAISRAEICHAIAVLAADSMEGREAGTAGAEMAAGWIAERFAALGLEPLVHGYRQEFSFPTALKRNPHVRGEGPRGERIEELASTTNVVAVLRGTDPSVRDEAIVIGAHYDHLGRGIAGSLDPGSGAIHNGADDNASGVAGILELAEAFATDPPARSLVVVAFGGEELGNLGSQFWVKSPLWPLENTIAMVNLDMIGRLRDALTVYGTGTSSAWPTILDSLAAAGAAPKLNRVPDGYGPSDHASFYGAEIPVLALFTGTHEQYHTPEDDVERIRAAGAERVIEFAAAVIETLADAGRRIPYSRAPETERRAAAFQVGLGVVPDYGHASEGLALGAVRAGGPADAAGLEAGDVIVRLAGREVEDIYGYTEILSELEAGEPVEVVWKRDGERYAATATPEPR